MTIVPVDGRRRSGRRSRRCSAALDGAGSRRLDGEAPLFEHALKATTAIRASAPRRLVVKMVTLLDSSWVRVWRRRSDAGTVPVRCDRPTVGRAMNAAFAAC